MRCSSSGCRWVARRRPWMYADTQRWLAVYLSTIERPQPDSNDGVRRRVGANVLALGVVSLVTDISSEMVVAVLPVYLVIGLSLSPAAYGVIDGVYTGATALLRIRRRLRRRPDRSAASWWPASGTASPRPPKLGLLAAGRSLGAVGAVIALDRAGKGLRSAPRDALITLSTPPENLGRAFGVHRMHGQHRSLPRSARRARGAVAERGSPSTPSSWPASASRPSACCSSSCSCGTTVTACRPPTPCRRAALPGCWLTRRYAVSWWPPACSAWSRSATASSTCCCSSVKTSASCGSRCSRSARTWSTCCLPCRSGRWRTGSVACR